MGWEVRSHQHNLQPPLSTSTSNTNTARCGMPATTTMGNQASAPAPSSQGKERLQRVCDEASKLFAMEPEEERHPGGSYRTTGHRAQTGRNSNSKQHKENNQTVTLQSVLEAASRGIDLGNNPAEDSDSTRDTCDSPLFAARPPRRRQQHGGVNSSHHPDMKIQPDSLLSHLFHSGNHQHHRGRRTSKNQPPLPGPTFPELNSSSGGGSQHQHLRSPVIKIPRRKQHHQVRVEEEEEEHLKRLYDSRTWKMYHRITEARAASRSGTSSLDPIGNSTMIPGGPPFPTFGGGGGCISSATDPTLQQQQQQQLGYADHDYQPEDEEHELMFGDLED